MAKKKIKTYSLDEMLDRHIGEIGTKKRDTFEFELNKEVLSSMIKMAREKRNLTQSQLGELIGVKKSQISKIESGLNNAKIETIIKIFKALKAELNFSIRFDEGAEFSMAS
ncbi:MAG: transcriptional regulator [Bacteroidetes bacterium]|nr:MAG: transcriptional regulator [Bacteroidota bacterium]